MQTCPICKNKLPNLKDHYIKSKKCGNRVNPPPPLPNIKRQINIKDKIKYVSYVDQDGDVVHLK